MNPLAKLAPLRAAYARLTHRERTLVALGAAGAGGFLIIVAALILAASISRAERRVRVKSEQLREVLELQDEYRTRQAERQEQMRLLGRQRVRLVSVVEEAATKAGVEIGQLRPDDSEPDPSGIVESRVDLRASGLSVDRLTSFLETIEDAQGVVVVRRLRLNRPYKKDTLNIEMTVSAYQTKE